MHPPAAWSHLSLRSWCPLMCELFVMSSSHPATVTYSMREFARHGGFTADHADGWGIAYLQDRDVRVFRDVDAAAESPCQRLVSALEFRSDIVLATNVPLTGEAWTPLAEGEVVAVWKGELIS